MLSKVIAEPDYTVTRHLGLVELRQYRPFVVAEMRVEQELPAQAIDQAFPVLAAYILGENKGAKTAPAQVGLKFEMSAPVLQLAVPGGHLVQFVLPPEVRLASAPEPLDPRVSLREVGVYPMAALRLAGFWSQANYDEHVRDMKGALSAAGLTFTGEPVYARYNAPFTPWSMRRTEIWLSLAPDPNLHPKPHGPAATHGWPLA
jgi:hypothetical protein